MAYLKHLREFVDGRGRLVPIEATSEDLPFEIKRVFFIRAVPRGAFRGQHAHRECEQFIIAVCGSFVVQANDKLFTLDDPVRGLYVPPGTFLTLAGFTADAVCLVLCSHHYDEEEVA